MSVTQIILHVRCGSDIREFIESDRIEGNFLEWGDPVSQGPVPSNLCRADYLTTRANYICEAWQRDDPGSTKQRFIDEEIALLTLDTYDKIILWFEHDLYDQSILIDLLSRIRERFGRLDNLYLLSINKHPDTDRFIGFGQLGADQLSALAGREIPVTGAMYDLAVRVWAAYRAPTPEMLSAALNSDMSALPFLKDAMIRHLQDLSWLTDGLSLTERLTLQAIDAGADTPGKAFGELMAHLDPQPFLGDLMYWAIFRTLSGGNTPALTPFEDPRSSIALTDFGRGLLGGAHHMITTNGINRWHGGTHLGSETGYWFWDDNNCSVQSSL